VAWFLLIFNILIIPTGAVNPSLGYGVVPFLLGVLVLLISVALYWVRKNVEDPRAASGAKAA
jgi:hypothetical protein